MKNEYKFMVGNEFDLNKFIKKQKCHCSAAHMPDAEDDIFFTMYFYFDDNRSFYFDDIKYFDLTGITAGCLISISFKHKYNIVQFQPGFIYLENRIDLLNETFSKRENEWEKQFHLRVAKEMGWV